jgi:Restriction endonuclease
VTADTSLAVILRQLAAPTVETGYRHQLLRLGARDPIIPFKRRLIYERDGFRCLWCQRSDVPLQLDHIKPWSAFPKGTPPEVADRSDNLRTLCEDCNLARSNLDWPEWTRVVGVVECCWDCMWSDPSDHQLPEDVTWLAYCGECGFNSRVSERWIL